MHISQHIHSFHAHITHAYTVHYLLHGSQAVLIHNGGLGVGHGPNDGHAPREGGGRTAGVVLFVGLAWVSDVDMHIHEARQGEDTVRGEAIDVRLDRWRTSQIIQSLWCGGVGVWGG